MMEDGLYDELGLIIPKVKLDSDGSLKPGEFRFRLNGQDGPAIRGLEADEFLVNKSVERLTLLKIDGKPAINPVNGSVCAMVREKGNVSKACRDAGLTIWGAWDSWQ